MAARIADRPQRRTGIEETFMHADRTRSFALAAATALMASAPAAAVDYPTLKNGQWEMTTSAAEAGAPPRKSTICLDANTQKSMIDMGVGMQKEMCTRMDMRREGARFITDAECKLGTSVIKSHGVMTMTGDTAYRTETSATFDPPLAKDMKESKTVIEGRYLGPCRDGMQPGDMVTDTGQKINVNQLQQRPPKGK
jgi:hypothetical protein